MKSRAAFFFILAAVFLFGLGRIATSPPFEDVDDLAHYSRLEATAFAREKDVASISSSADDFYRGGGPVPYCWEANPAAGENGEYRDMLHYQDFFSTPGAVERYTTRYRDTPAPQSFAPSNMRNWQYQHPPLWYTLFSRALKAAADMSLTERFLVLRSANWLLAFCGFALGLFAILRYAGQEKRHTIALLGAFYPFLTPVFFNDLARLGNDNLCLFLFSTAFALLLLHLRQPEKKAIWILLGLTLGLGWLVKAFMIPVSLGLLLFLALRHGTNKTSGWRRGLLPVAVITAATLAAGAWPYVTSLTEGRLLGSEELGAWMKTGLPGNAADDSVSANMIFMVTTMFYTLTDFIIPSSFEPLAAYFGLLALPLWSWLSRLPRDPGREEWIPLFAVLPLVCGLVVHSLFARITPGYYIHALAPALAFAFGMGFVKRSASPEGRLIVGGLMIGGMAISALTMALRITLLTGCSWFSEDYNRMVFAEDGICRPETMYDRLGILAWPGPGLSLLALSLLLLAGGVILALKTLKTDKT